MSWFDLGPVWLTLQLATLTSIILIAVALPLAGRMFAWRQIQPWSGPRRK